MTADGSPQATENLCAESKREDGRHSWRFDGDDPYVICVYCGARQHTLTGLNPRVSPAADGSPAVDAIRRALRHTNFRVANRDGAHPDFCEGCKAEAALAALVAELDAQRGEVVNLRDRAVCSGCGQDVDEGGYCSTPECDDGEMIPASELPGALLHASEQRTAERDEWRADWEQLRAEAKQMEAERDSARRERDALRDQIAQVKKALRDAPLHMCEWGCDCVVWEALGVELGESKP